VGNSEGLSGQTLSARRADEMGTVYRKPLILPFRRSINNHSEHAVTRGILMLIVRRQSRRKGFTLHSPG
jgi:hypothetical protein